jgi:hypothetical protein
MALMGCKMGLNAGVILLTSCHAVTIFHNVRQGTNWFLLKEQTATLISISARVRMIGHGILSKDNEKVNRPAEAQAMEKQQ